MSLLLRMSNALSVLRHYGFAGICGRVRKIQRLRRCHREQRKLNYRYGWRSKRPILVIESDDWGSEHVPGQEAIRQMEGMNFFREGSSVIFDGLETCDDIDRLCNVLGSHKDINGNPAVITANFVMSNPDYAAIKESGYSVFKSKAIDTGWNHESDAGSLWESYRRAINGGTFVPQLHGFVHFNWDEWLGRLRESDGIALMAFELQMIGEEEDSEGIGRQSMGPIYDADVEAIWKLVSEGVAAFKRAFGQWSVTTVAPCYFWRSPETEEALLAHNVRAMQTKCQLLPGGVVKPHYMGECGHQGMVYTTRNCTLEPLTAQSTVDQCVWQISKAFEVGLPAIVCSHRFNYTSRVSRKVRDKGLSILDGVLEAVTHKWPDVEFLSSDKLALRIIEGNQDL